MSFEFQICSIEHMKYFMNPTDLFLALKNVVSYKSADNVILREETASFSFRLETASSVSDKKLQLSEAEHLY